MMELYLFPCSLLGNFLTDFFNDNNNFFFSSKFKLIVISVEVRGGVIFTFWVLVISVVLFQKRILNFKFNNTKFLYMADSLSDFELEHNRGLQNKIGENNCFLNVVIQSLWHLEEFRKNFKRSTHYHINSSNEACIFCALEVHCFYSLFLSNWFLPRSYYARSFRTTIKWNDMKSFEYHL